MDLVERIAIAVNEAIQNALGVSLLDMVVQLLATVLLVFIVKKFFWTKVTDFLDKRRAIMEDEQKTAENLKKDALSLKAETDKLHQDLLKKQKEIILKAKEKAEFEKASIIEKAQAEASDLILEGKKEMLHEQEKFKEQMRHEVIDLASSMAMVMIEAEIDPEKYESLVVDQIERSNSK